MRLSNSKSGTRVRKQESSNTGYFPPLTQSVKSFLGQQHAIYNEPQASIKKTARSNGSPIKHQPQPSSYSQKSLKPEIKSQKSSASRNSKRLMKTPSGARLRRSATQHILIETTEKKSMTGSRKHSLDGKKSAKRQGYKTQGNTLDFEN